MGILDDIQTAVARLQAANDAYRPKSEVEHDVWVDSLDEIERSKDTFEYEGKDWVKALLPVVEAAKRIGEPLVVTDGQTRTECACCGRHISGIDRDEHAQDCSWLILQKALKTLE